MNMRLSVPTIVVTETLKSLKAAGERDAEGVVLWLGRRTDFGAEVEEAYVPEYESASHRFWIPPSAMASLLRRLRHTGTFLAAQVHSHPQEAFHSQADDEWAIVRHLGALSLVVPHFAGRTSDETFLEDIAAFALSAENRWVEVPPTAVKEAIRII